MANDEDCTECSWPEIGAALGISKSTVEQAGRRAIRRLWRMQVRPCLRTGRDAVRRFGPRPDITDAHIRAMLVVCGGNRREAGRRLGISHRTILRRLGRAGVPSGADITAKPIEQDSQDN